MRHFTRCFDLLRSLFVICLFLIVIVLSFGPKLSFASTPCTDFNQFIAAPSTGDAIERLKGAFKALWSDEAPMESDLYFMNSGGFSLRLKCRGNALYAPHLYYPMGLVVKKLDSDNIRLGNGKIYILVEAEHGLKMYVDQTHLQAIEPGYTYVFANSLKFEPYCLGTRTCDAARRLEAMKKKRYLSPTGYYAGIRGDLTACDESPVTLYKQGHHTVYRADGRVQSAMLNICQMSDATDEKVWPEGVKIVTFDKYKDYFSFEVGGNYQRFTDTVLAKLIPFSTNRKDCNEVSMNQINNRIGAGGGVDVTIYVAKLSAGASTEKILENLTTLPDGIYIFYSSYLFHQQKFDAIEIFFNCDDKDGGRNLNPISLYSIKIHNSNVDGGEIIINGQELIDVIIDLSRSNGSKLDGITYASQAGRKIGRYWKVNGYYEYFRLREAYSLYLANF